MASLTLLLLVLFFSPSLYAVESQLDDVPIVLPITKDPANLRYTLQLHLPNPTPLSVDLGGRYLSLSSTFSPANHRQVPCLSTLCAAARFSSCSPTRTCTVPTLNPFTGQPSTSDLVLATLSLPSRSLGRFLLRLSPPLPLSIVGLGRGTLSLPSQLSSSFNLPLQFSLCLPSSISFGDATLASNSLLFTPLLAGEGYRVGVRAVRVNRRPVSSFHATVEARISTVDPYAIAETSILDAIAEAFESAGNLRRAYPAVPPFSRCYSTADGATPEIDLMLQSEAVAWRLKPVVEIGPRLVCLAFVDGGERPETPIVIGGHQLEHNLLLFDLARSRLGFSSSTLLDLRRNKTDTSICANHNIISTQRRTEPFRGSPPIWAL